MLKLAAALAITLGACLGASAQTYPAKPITLVVPFAPGGTVNLMGRILATRMSELLGQTVIVDNKAGAGGSIGASFVAKAPADGYTLVFATQGQQSIQPLLSKKLPYDAIKDFAPIALFSTVPNVLAVSPDTPAKTVAELVQYAKTNPGKLNMASAGIGSVNHLTGELFMLRTGVNFTHTPYRGAGPATADLLAGQAQLMFANLPNVLPYVQSGRVRVLAIASDKRNAAIPDVPTLAEAGVKDATVESWYGVMAPARTDPKIIKKLQDTVLAIANEKPMAAHLADLGARPFPGTSEDMARLSNEETKRWSEVIKHANVQMN
ncbi:MULTISPECIES: tripartite tricarboxylate transporter substrate binding protein [unclassified Variovorax]|uniref:Bug family tripartite tricarboxylate transporter substrate binding protein n=1 Tax=unclassified Variovorax TaxID=663243 RepID=UPI002574C1B4|nr:MULTISPECIES: tripartite tricarboxylate transporter substrate binding protein [unclassified Variovorax]MDM0089318.1 tripartite tricarboxylate transporter substrate binding protein [Variovorax sp. J22G40]MDM0147391.1 tripartite tricarboxylate transporter substrate binding protein [Variovorax sp. J2P1-31]